MSRADEFTIRGTLELTESGHVPMELFTERGLTCHPPNTVASPLTELTTRPC